MEGEVVVKAQETKGSKSRVVEWFRVRETVMDEQDSNSNRVSDAERIRISYLIESIYGGLAAIFESIPLLLAATGEIVGIPLSESDFIFRELYPGVPTFQSCALYSSVSRQTLSNAVSLSRLGTLAR
jgi:hypothetical protein